MKIATVSLVVALAIAPAAAFAAQTAATPNTMKPTGGTQSATTARPADPATSPATKAYMASMQQMMKDTGGMPMTGDPDMDFVMMMIPHHQAAVDMAETELKYGTDKQLRALAGMIVVAQRKEINDMKRWQSAHGK